MCVCVCVTSPPAPAPPQDLHKKLTPACKWISSIDVHPGGDNLILGSYDKRICWFDLDLSAAPYKTLRSHTLAVRKVRYLYIDTSHISSLFISIYTRICMYI